MRLGLEVDIYISNMKSKPFSHTLFKDNDPQSREVVIEYMHSCGFEFYSNKDKYGVDLVSYFDSPKVGLELEHRLNWVGDTFPFGCVNIPYRKVRVLGHKNIHYVILNADFSCLGIILGSVLAEYMNKGKVLSNELMREELFYQVPREAFKWIRIK